MIGYVDQAAAPPRVPPRVKIRGICGCGGIGRLIGFRFQRASVQVRVLSSAPSKRARHPPRSFALWGRQDEDPSDADVRWTSAHSRLDGNDTLIPSSPVSHFGTPSNPVIFFNFLASCHPRHLPTESSIHGSIGIFIENLLSYDIILISKF